MTLTLATLKERFFYPVSIYPLVALRLCFGTAMALWALVMMVSGHVGQLYKDTTIHFPFKGLEWITPLPYEFMLLIFSALIVVALFMAAGWYFRRSAMLFILFFSYVSFCDKAAYLSYYSFVILIAFMLLVSPAHRLFSLDLLRKPHIRVDYAPHWLLLAFKLQVVMLFFFAGMAKLNYDWLFTGLPITLWLQDVFFSFGWSAEVLFSNPWIGISLSWCLVLFDFILPHFLMDTRTSKKAFGLVVLVQVPGMLIFPTGMFPLLVLLMCTVFLPHEPIHLLVSKISYFLYDFFQFKGEVFNPGGVFMLKYKMERLFPVIAAIYFSIQILLPIYLFLSWGSFQWANKAFHFSWDLNVNQHRKPNIEFVKVNRLLGHIEPIEVDHLINAFQKKEMANDPEMLKTFIMALEHNTVAPSKEQAFEIQALRCYLSEKNIKQCSVIYRSECDGEKRVGTK
jgi:hypothetical protein